MPHTTAMRLEHTDFKIALATSSVSEDHRMKLEEMRFDDDMKDRQHGREQEARETEIRKINLENERLRLQYEDARQVREHEVSIQRQEQERTKEMKLLQMEESRRDREHELLLKQKAQDAMKLKLELAQATKDIEKQKLAKTKLKFSDDRHAREHKERMAAIEVEKLKAEEEIKRHRLDERRIVTEETQQLLSELNNRYEQLKRRCRQVDDDDIRSLKNLGLVATGVAAASGAIGGALGTAAAVGLAAGVAGAATVLAPVTGAVAIMSGAGYFYKKATSSNRD